MRSAARAKPSATKSGSHTPPVGSYAPIVSASAASRGSSARMPALSSSSTTAPCERMAAIAVRIRGSRSASPTARYPQLTKPGSEPVRSSMSARNSQP